MLPSVPVTIRLDPGTVVGLTGPRRDVLAMARSMVLQLAVAHGPADMSLAVMAEHRAAADWDWAKWLPHTGGPGGESRLLFAGQGAGAALAEDLRRLPEDRSFVAVLDAEGMPDGGNASVRAVFRDAQPVAGIVLASCREALPDVCDRLVSVDAESGDGVLQPRRGRPTTISALGAAAETAEACAQRLARYRDPELSRRAEQVPVECRLVELLGLAGAGGEGVRRRWEQPRHDELAVPVGLAPDGPVVFHLAGPTPHLLIVGAGRSGKSEMLRTVAFGLAATADPGAAQLVLVGRELAPCMRLPHVVASYSALDDGVLGELVRALDDESRAGRADLARLVVIVDDLTAVAKRAPRVSERLLDSLRRQSTPA